MKEKVDNFKKNYKDLKKTPKGKAIIKLVRYLIFIFFLIIAMIVTGVGKDNNMASKNVHKESFESKEDVTYKDKQEKLFSEDYTFEYNVTGEINVKYTGTSKNDVIEGYKEDASGIKKYAIVDGTNYLIEMDESTIYEELYDGLDSMLFNYETMFSNLNTKMAKITNEKNIKKYYYENVDGYNYLITLDDNHITNIMIEGTSLTYNFSFTY